MVHLRDRRGERERSRRRGGGDTERDLAFLDGELLRSAALGERSALDATVASRCTGLFPDTSRPKSSKTVTTIF